MSSRTRLRRDPGSAPRCAESLCKAPARGFAASRVPGRMTAQERRSRRAHEPVRRGADDGRDPDQYVHPRKPDAACDHRLPRHAIRRGLGGSRGRQHQGPDAVARREQDQRRVRGQLSGPAGDETPDAGDRRNHVRVRRRMDRRRDFLRGLGRQRPGRRRHIGARRARTAAADPGRRLLAPTHGHFRRQTSVRRRRAAHLPSRASAERVARRRLLPPHRARAVADLLARRDRQPRPWRLLRHRRLSCRPARAARRLRRRLHRLAGARRRARHAVRALLLPPLLPLRSDPQSAPHLRPCDGDRAVAAHDLRCGAAAVLDPARASRAAPHRRFHLPALSADDFRRRARRHRRDLVPRLPHCVRSRRAGGRAEPRHGRRARHLAAALHDRRRGARGRARRARWRAARTDLRRPSGYGRRDPHRRLRRRGDRRARLVLGGDRRRRPRRRRARGDDLRQPVLRRGVDVPPDGARAADAPARAPRRAHPEIRVADAAGPCPSADRRRGARDPAFRARLGRVAAALVDRRRGVRDHLPRAECARRLYRARLVRPWRLVRACGLRGGAQPEILVPGRARAPGAVCAPLHRRRGSTRRRPHPEAPGVYFSLLTLALTALLFAIGYRWTEFTGGESGLGGVTRATVLGLNLERDAIYYWVVAAVGFIVAFLLWRFHRSPAGSVLVAIRENEQRARFLGYPTNRYKLLGFVISATVVGVAGVLSVFNHRFAAAEPLAVAFSGELIAMVVIGGMRSFLGPALGALFYILFREFLSIWTANWLLYFGLLFVGFIIFSPTGLVGVAQRVLAPLRKKPFESAAMDKRTLSDEPLPPFPKPS